MSKRYIYMAVTNDEFELPLCNVDTVADLAEWCGLTDTQIYKIFTSENQIKKEIRDYKLVKVRVIK